MRVEVRCRRSDIRISNIAPPNTHGFAITEADLNNQQFAVEAALRTLFSELGSPAERSKDPDIEVTLASIAVDIEDLA